MSVEAGVKREDDIEYHVNGEIVVQEGLSGVGEEIFWSG